MFLRLLKKVFGGLVAVVLVVVLVAYLGAQDWGIVWVCMNKEVWLPYVGAAFLVLFFGTALVVIVVETGKVLVRLCRAWWSLGTRGLVLRFCSKVAAFFRPEQLAITLIGWGVVAMLFLALASGSWAVWVITLLLACFLASTLPSPARSHNGRDA